ARNSAPIPASASRSRSRSSRRIAAASGLRTAETQRVRSAAPASPSACRWRCSRVATDRGPRASRSPPADSRAGETPAVLNRALLLHATTVAIDGAAVLLRGPSGSGKSDLALRLIDAGARLVADDQSELRRVGEVVVVRAPDALRGLIEVRG